MRVTAGQALPVISAQWPTAWLQMAAPYPWQSLNVGPPSPNGLRRTSLSPLCGRECLTLMDHLSQKALVTQQEIVLSVKGLGPPDGGLPGMKEVS